MQKSTLLISRKKSIKLKDNSNKENIPTSKTEEDASIPMKK